MSWYASISADGRFVAFESLASDLVPGDTNGKEDVFIRDRLLGTTERVSVSSSGQQGNDLSEYPSISADGRFVAFESLTSNLVSGDTNGYIDTFVRDRLLGTTERVSVSSSGEQGCESGDPSMSADGRFVAFTGGANLVPGSPGGLLVRDRLLGTTESVSVSSSGEQGNEGGGIGCSSADGRFVAFVSYSSNLVTGDANNVADVFLRDRLKGTTERVSVSTDGEQGNDDCDVDSFSTDGRFVAFSSWASNVVPGDMNGAVDVFVRDRLLGTTELVSISTVGEQGNGMSWWPSVSADGRLVEFDSEADNLVPGDTNNVADVFIRDQLGGTTQRVSVSSDGEQGNGGSWHPSMSADGRFAAFKSDASNLVPDDTNKTDDVFAHQLTEPISVSGKVALDDYVGVEPDEATFEFRMQGLPKLRWGATLTAEGTFVLPAPAGVFDLSVKPCHWLRRTVRVDTTWVNETEDVGTLILVSGDADDNNNVGLGDLSWVLANWGGTDPMADLDGNGSVGFGDLSIVLVNFGLTGDP